MSYGIPGQFTKSGLRRIRGKNFTDHERDVVLKIIENYKNIIDSKKTDAETIRLKNGAWLEVTEEFNNVSPSCIRTPSQLRVFYENYKVKLRKELAEQGIKNEQEEIPIKRMKLTDSEEKLLVKYQKSIPYKSPAVEYNNDIYSNSIEASTSNLSGKVPISRDSKNFMDNNFHNERIVICPDPNATNNFSNSLPFPDDEDECSSEPVKIVAEVDPLDDNKYNVQESSAKTLETVKPSQAYAAIVESNKANCKYKTKKADYVDDYNRLKIELIQTELKLKSKEYENILIGAAMEQKMNAVKLKILECELEIKKEQLKKERERNT